MATKKSTSNKKTASKKKATTKKTTSKKKSTAKKASTKKATKKTSTKRKPAKKKSSSQKNASKRSSSRVKKSSKKKGEKDLFILSLKDASGPVVHVNPDALTPLDHIPVVDLDASGESANEPVVVSTVRTIRSRVAFYMGVFFGAVVVNVLLVTVLTFLSV